jgi:uncharacterized protein
VQYWREGADEVDFVLTTDRKMLAIEVKSGQNFAEPKGLARFCGLYASARPVVVGEGGIAITEFLSHPAAHWLG